MKVLFLTLAYPEDKQRNIYTDLMTEFVENGNEVYIACQRERREGKDLTYKVENKANVLRIKTGNITKTNMIEKGFSTLSLEKHFINAIKKYFANIKFDIVIYSTPPITFEKVVRFIKNRDSAYTYLLLKDIFPQNAVDLELIKKEGFIHKYFRKKEKRLYMISDKIGCMSNANMKYILEHNSEVKKNQIEVCANSIKPMEVYMSKDEISDLYVKYNIPKDKILCIYGGNLGRPQGIDFLLQTLEVFENKEEAFFMIIGSGTEYNKINDFIKNNKFENILLMSSIPKEDYDKLLHICDIGLIYLDNRFTIPNFPSRFTAYMESSIPTFAITDTATDIGDIIEENNLGIWSRSGDLDAFKLNLEKLLIDKDLRVKMGENSKRYLYDNYHVKDTYKIIIDNLKGREKSV